MFALSEIEHTLRLPPHLLDRPLNDVIKGELDSIFLDKVIDKLGLCVSVYDIRSIDGGFIFPSDGASTYTVKFRLVMFRPFVDEVILARVKESREDGIQLTLGFFDDIHIPVHLMCSETHFEHEPGHKALWIWKSDEEDFPMEEKNEIRFKVHSVSYPPVPKDHGQNLEQKDVKPFSPMVVT
ncbi:RNA polymerase Rpb7 N-terminal domain-containing protein, partial [Perilla frutescens var. hirtella]